jgi:DNA-binding NarL/FixJ family response regulator
MPNRPGRDGKPHHVDLPDFGAISLGNNPNQTMRILGMIRAGNSYDYIIQVGHYHGTWSKADVDRILRDNKVRIPEAPDTNARTAFLTPREMQVVHHLCQAQNDQEIAQTLGVTDYTVRAHINKALASTGCRDRITLVVQILTGQLAPIPETPNT